MRSERHRSGLAFVWALGLVGAACLPPTLEVPADARIGCSASFDCPAGFGCLEGPGRCAPFSSGCLEDDGNFARPSEDGTSCAVDGVAGACSAGVCGSSCGNGSVDAAAGELCDFGADNSDRIADRCRTDCLPARCGDGVIDAGESCDSDDGGCDACFLVCDAGTVDDNRRAVDGCEASMAFSFSAPAGVAQLLTVVGDVITYVDTDSRAIRRYTISTGADRVFTQRSQFVSEIAIAGTTTAWTEGTTASMFTAGPDGVAVAAGDQITAIAGGGGRLYTMGVEVLQRRTPATGDVETLPGELTFPPFLKAGDAAVVWSTGDGLRVLAHADPANASRLAAPGVQGIAAAALEGEVLWYLDDALSLWRAEPGDAPVRLAPMPAALAGHFPTGGMVVGSPGRIVTALTLDPEGLEDGDEIAALLEADAAGTWQMRAREETNFLSLAVSAGSLWLSTSLGVVEVPR